MHGAGGVDIRVRRVTNGPSSNAGIWWGERAAGGL